MEKKYLHEQVEPALQKQWADHGTFSFIPTAGPRGIWSIDTPPPTVSGSLHIGHIFSYTQTDIGARYKRLQGYAVYYPFGFDDNGLPTERYVEKEAQVVAHSMERSAFIALCLEKTQKVETEFKQLWQRMGLSVDWTQCYSTIDTRAQKISQASFIELYKKGYIYRRDEPALYCVACRTSVAQAELDDKQEPSTFNYITFTTNDGEPVTIATTRPELLPACVAVLYNPKDTRYTHLQGKTATVPVFNYNVPFIADETVKQDKGSGLVMCCTFGDKTDIEWYKKHNFEYKPAFGRDGRFLPHTGILAGLKAKQARQAILEALAQAQALIKSEPLVHTVNIHERCKQEIEYLALPQWFLKILPYKQDLIACADTIEWYPAYMKTRYVNWVENIGWDWCLSRQRFFGIPFPVWHCTACDELLFPPVEQLPVDPQEVAYEGACTNCGSHEIVPDTDVMDTWNTSSLTPYLCASLFTNSTDTQALFKSDFIPMGMRPQAHDIIRTWAFYTIVKTWMHQKSLPWKQIVISGHVLSTEKEKISKSQGNSPLQPHNLLAKYPADAIRYWTAASTLGTDTAFSENQIKIGQRLIVKLWNAFLFIKEHAVKPAATPAPHDLVNTWILSEAHSCFKDYCAALDKNEYGLALNRVEQFFWSAVCDNYLEYIKDRLFNPTQYAAQEVDETRATLYTLGLLILQYYAPFVPHVTDALYQEIYASHEAARSVHTMQYLEYPLLLSAEQKQLIEAVHSVVAQVRKLKSDHQLSLKTEIEELSVNAPAEVQQALKTQDVLLKGITRAKQISFSTAVHATAAEQRENTWYATVVVE